MGNRAKGMTILELVTVAVILTIVLGFGVASYLKVIYRIREGEIITQLTAIHGISQIYKSKNGAYWNSVGLVGVSTINANLGTNVLENEPIEYYYNGSGGVYIGMGFHNDSNKQFQVNIYIDSAMEEGINPCCDSSYDSCPTLPDC